MKTLAPLDTMTIRVEHRLTVVDVAELLAAWWNTQPDYTPHPRPGQVRSIVAGVLHTRGRTCHPRSAGAPPMWALRVARAALLPAPSTVRTP